MPSKPPWPDIWRPLPGLPGYLISWSGRVIGPSGKELAQHNHRGYARLSVGQGRSRTGVFVSTLVMLAFRGPCPSGLHVMHRDDDGMNNWLGNLDYGTPKQNCATRIHGNSKKTECPHGHDYADDNIYWQKGPTGMQRKCRICHLARVAARKKALA